MEVPYLLLCKCENCVIGGRSTGSLVARAAGTQFDNAVEVLEGLGVK